MLHVLILFCIYLLPGSHAVDAINSKKSKSHLVVSEAKKLLKSAYKYGGKSPKGFDCSGFTQYVFKKAVNVKLSASSSTQVKQGKKVKLKKAQAGDLIFFKRKKRINHVGIVYKNNKDGLWVIHSTSSKGVILEEISRSAYWKPKIAVVKRVI